MTSNWFVNMAYFIAAIVFIFGLKAMSSPVTARKGVVWAGYAMIAATLATFFIPDLHNIGLMVVAIVLGGGVAWYSGKVVKMTDMPQMVAIYNGMGGGAAAGIAAIELVRGVPHDAITSTLLALGAVIGAVAFSGSCVAFAKLQGLVSGSPLVFKGQHPLNALLGIALVVLLVWFAMRGHTSTFVLLIVLSLALGFLLILPIGGADMPVVVSMLNSYSGWAAAGIGFTLGNTALIVTGALVGSSGAILSYIMCKGMNRSIFNVILGGFGGDAGAAAGGAQEQRPVKSGSAEDAAFMLGNADSVIIVPGYGLAVARAQHAVKELVDKLTDKGIDVKYAIHPVAGRMPGHMNVLLAEAEVPYDQVHEMEDVNGEFGQADVAIILGANDVVNPAALQKGSPIYGMPILEAYKAKTVIVNKRSMAAGYAGLDNELFYMDKTMMVFGDAKKVVEDIGKAIE